MIELTIGVAIALVTALTEVVKRLGLPSKFAPLTSLIFGLILAFVINYPTFPLRDTVILGLIVGLSASGLYSGGKTVLTNTKK